MRDIREHQGILQVLQRLPSSINGNPRYLVSIGGAVCKTAVDSSLGYSITNYENKQVTATIGTHYGSKTIDSLKGAQ